MNKYFIPCRQWFWLRGAVSAVTLILITQIAGAAVSDLRITEVNPATGQVEVTNTAVTTLTLATNLPFSHLADTASFVPALTQFVPGEAKVFIVSALNASDSDLWLYSDNNFASASSIITGLKWGSAPNVGRTSVAVSAGIWPATTSFTSAQTSTALSLRLVAYDSHIPANWAEGVSTFGAFFGTGVAIPDPLPDIPKSATRVDLTPIASGLVSPVTVTEPNDGTGRLFICDQIGKLRVVEAGNLLPTPLLDVTGRMVTLSPGYDERGLIGFTLHPNFTVNHKLYTLTSEPKGSIPADFPSAPSPQGFNHQGVVAEWTIDSNNANMVDVSSRREIFRVDEPQSNHNGGTLNFGADGYLYVSLGDGGNRDDEGSGHLPDGNAQSLSNVLGKVLRIQIDGGPFLNGKYGVPADNPFIGQGIPEIYAHGFRNPYFFSFDRQTNDLYLADVGQGFVEEVDIVTKGGNYGWRLKEGGFFFDPTGNGFTTTIPFKPLPTDLIEPIAQYDHDDGISVIGGFVYHGSALPALAGHYVFGDFGLSFGSPTGKLLYLNNNGDVNQLTIGSMDRELGLWLKGYGQDQEGELYVCGSRNLGPSGTSGVVLKLVGTTAAQNWALYD